MSARIPWVCLQRRRSEACGWDIIFAALNERIGRRRRSRVPDIGLAFLPQSRINGGRFTHVGAGGASGTHRRPSDVCAGLQETIIETEDVNAERFTGQPAIGR